MKMRIIAITAALLLLLACGTAQAVESAPKKEFHEPPKYLNVVSQPREFLKSSDPDHFVEVTFDGPIVTRQIPGLDTAVVPHYIPPVKYEISGNTIKIFSPGTGNAGSVDIYLPYFGWANVGVAGDYAVLEAVDFPGGGDVIFKVHVQLSPSDPRPVVGRKVRLEIQTQGDMGSVRDGAMMGWPITVGVAAEGVTDQNGDALLTAHFYRRDGAEIMLKNLKGFDASIPLDSKSKMHRLVAFVAPENQMTVLNSWQTWYTGPRWMNELPEPFSTSPRGTLRIGPGGVSNSIDLTPDILDKALKTVKPGAAVNTENQEAMKRVAVNTENHETVKPGSANDVSAKPNQPFDAPLDTVPVVGKVYGYVVDSDNQPVVGARVELRSDPRSTITDEKGFYEFLDVPFGQHTVTVSGDRFREAQRIDIILDPTGLRVVHEGSASTGVTLTEADREKRVDFVVVAAPAADRTAWPWMLLLVPAALAAARFLPFPVPFFRTVNVSVELQPSYNSAKAVISRDSRGPREVKVDFVCVSPSNRITQEIILPKNASRIVEIPAGELVTAKIRTPNWKNVSKKTLARLYFKNGGVDKEWSG